MTQPTESVTPDWDDAPDPNEPPGAEAPIDTVPTISGRGIVLHTYYVPDETNGLPTDAPHGARLCIYPERYNQETEVMDPLVFGKWDPLTPIQNVFVWNDNDEVWIGEYS